MKKKPPIYSPLILLERYGSRIDEQNGVARRNYVINGVRQHQVAVRIRALAHQRRVLVVVVVVLSAVVVLTMICILVFPQAIYKYHHYHRHDSI